MKEEGKEKSIIIDGHAHACGVFLNGQDILVELDKLNVDKIVLVPGEFNSTKNYWIPPLASFFPKINVVKWTNWITSKIIPLTRKLQEVSLGNSYVFKLVNQSPERIIQFYWLTQSVKDVKNELEDKFNKWHFKGLKLHQCWDFFSIESDFFKIAAEFAEQKNLPLFIHMQSEKEMEYLVAYKRRHPKLKLIVAHLFGMEIVMKKGLRLENLFWEISSPQLISTYRFQLAYSYFGAEALILGSDTPYGKMNLKKNIERILLFKMTQGERNLILGDNMKRLLECFT